MRYILNSSKKQTVPIQNEIEFIEHYIAFERERLGTRCNIAYHKTQRSLKPNIIPLTLFNFIENAFKHGTLSIGQSTVSINLVIDENYIALIVSNPIHKPPVFSTKLGIENTKRRLELLYSGKYQLNICEAGGLYTVSLEITV